MTSRRLGLALVLGFLLVAVVLPSPVSAQGSSSSSPFRFLRNSFDSIRQQTRRSFDGFVETVQNTTTRAAEGIVRFVVVRSTDDEICYRILGCFSLKSPWISLNRPLPAPRDPEDINVRYYLYTRETPERFSVDSGSQFSLEGSSFDGDKTTFFLVHGFQNSGNDTWVADLKDVLLDKVDGNVFIVDWGGGAKDPNYLQVASNTRVVGREIAWLGSNLIKSHGASAQKMHFIGHSLGAHISGYAARNITSVARVTALDPAGPGFEALPRLVRLSKYVADFVDVLHTNAKPLTALGFGMMHPIGHVDFYLNGGVSQPGCSTPAVDTPTTILDLVSFPVTAVNELISCSHSRSHQYLIEAINTTSCRMWGHKVRVVRQRLLWQRNIPSEVVGSTGPCTSAECIPIGLDTPQFPARGVFAAVTDSASPFCLAEYSGDGQSLEEMAQQLGY